MYVRQSGNGYHTPGPLVAAWHAPTVLLVFTSTPTPVLYAPLVGAYSNGVASISVATSENDATVYATLSDSPPVGVASQLNLTGATVTFVLSAVGMPALGAAASSPALSNPGRIVSATEGTVAYDLTSADLSSLTGWSLYRWSFVVTWPSHQTREFGNGLVYVYPPNAQ